MKDVASHTATDIQELLAIQPKDIMMSLDQKAAVCSAYVCREQKFIETEPKDVN